MRIWLYTIYWISGLAGATSLLFGSPQDLTEWSRGIEPPGDQPIQISIALALQNADIGAETLLRISDPASSDYGQHLSTEAVARMFRPSPSAVTDIMNWLKEANIDQRNITLTHGGDHLMIDSSVHEASSLLNTTFYHHKHPATGQEQIACRHYHTPEPLTGSIDYILAAAASPTHHHIPRGEVKAENNDTVLPSLPPNCYRQTSLSCLRKLYRIPSDITPHPNNSLGIFEPSWYTWIPEDMDQFSIQMQPDLIGRRPIVEPVNGGYLQTNLTGPHWNEEPNLDFQYAMALTSPQEVTNIQVGSYERVGNLHDMLAAFDKYFCGAVGMDDQRYPRFYPAGCNATGCDCGTISPPKVLSISWGWTEAGFSAEYLHRQCLEFLKLGLMGTTVVVGVSDHGVASADEPRCIDDDTGNATSGRFSPTFPSSCPWVTSVGGTQMLQPTDLSPATANTNETAFRKTVAGQLASSGGGFSNVFPRPSYQDSNVASYKRQEEDHLYTIRDRFNSTGRGYPDVALRADDYPLVVNGQWKLVSGTSASSPVFASIITMINSERMHAGKGPVGFINPVLYSNSDVLNDVVTGANQGCGVDEAFEAVTGWDPVTGLGSPDYEQMRDVFVDLL